MQPQNRRRFRANLGLALAVGFVCVLACISQPPRVIQMLPMPQLSTLPASPSDTTTQPVSRPANREFELPPLPASGRQAAS